MIPEFAARYKSSRDSKRATAAGLDALVKVMVKSMVRDRGASDKAGKEVEACARPMESLIGNPTHHGLTKMPMMICPAKQFKYHPDKAIRRLAYAQARASHKLWGPCMKWNEPRTRRTISTIQEPKPGLRPYQARMIGRRG